MSESANGVPVPRLAILRKRAGISQRELAERAGVGKNTISRLEQGGNARYDTIEKLAQALGTRRSTLIQPLRARQTHHHQPSGSKA